MGLFTTIRISHYIPGTMQNILPISFNWILLPARCVNSQNLFNLPGLIYHWFFGICEDFLCILEYTLFTWKECILFSCWLQWAIISNHCDWHMSISFLCFNCLIYHLSKCVTFLVITADLSSSWFSVNIYFTHFEAMLFGAHKFMSLWYFWWIISYPVM